MTVERPHLWPARPEYLRRGTPVWIQRDHPAWAWDPGTVWCAAPDENGLRTVAVLHPGRTDWLHWCRPDIRHLRLDLRDVTARAHAAWAHHTWRRGTPYLAERLPMGSEHGSVLTRMAHGDPSVTVAEARTALAWAEEVTDGA